MAFPIGSIPLTGGIGTTDPADTFPTHFDYLAFAGMRAVADSSERDAITGFRRAFGMLVFSVADNALYVLANISMGGASDNVDDNSNWLVFSGGTPSAGSIWYVGAGAPSSGLGVDNDQYLDSLTGDVYSKTAGAWSITANIRGPQGIQGDQGNQGDPGTPGQGVPTGGTANQILAKIDGADYNTQWVNPSGGGVATVTGLDTDNANPANPVVKIKTTAPITGDGTPAVPLVINGPLGEIPFYDLSSGDLTSDVNFQKTLQGILLSDGNSNVLLNVDIPVGSGGSRNVFIAVSALSLSNIRAATSNIGIGRNLYSRLRDGINNIAIGSNVLDNIADKSNNVGIGSIIDFDIAVSNSIAIGNDIALVAGDSFTFAVGGYTGSASVITHWIMRGIKYEMPSLSTTGFLFNNGSGILSWQPTSGGSGITSINGDTTAAQVLAAGTAGTNFAISTVSGTTTFNLPTASASNRGALSSADWSTFNGKLSSVSVTARFTGNGTSGTPLELANTTVTPGSYTSANITIDAQGRITAAANGSGGGGISALTGDVTASGSGSVPATVKANLKTAQINVVLDGAGGVIAAPSFSNAVTIPFSGTITGWTVYSTDPSTGLALTGSVVVDGWLGASGGAIPTVANTIFSGNKPTLSSASYNINTSMSVAVTAGQVIIFRVDSCTLCVNVGVTLQMTRS